MVDARDLDGASGPVLPGTFVDGKYRVESLIGVGGMGAVYEAEQVHAGRTVAMKVLLPEHKHAADRFYREARLALELRHPHIVHAFDGGMLPDGLPYLVMERLEGRTLGEHLRTAGALAVTDAIEITRQILSALSLAHARGIVHRDLKPDNIFLLEGVGRTWAKLFDFGISRSLAGPSMTLQGTLLGTPEYVPPEQLRGDGDIDHRADLWSVGVLLYECIVGRLPFSGSNLQAVVYQILTVDPAPLAEACPAIPPGLERVVSTALAKDRDDRFGSALTMLDALVAAGRRPRAFEAAAGFAG